MDSGQINLCSILIFFLISGEFKRIKNEPKVIVQHIPEGLATDDSQKDPHVEGHDEEHQEQVEHRVQGENQGLEEVVVEGVGERGEVKSS